MEKNLCGSDLFRFNNYKNFIIKNGGNKNLFDFPAITDIIKDFIINGDPILKAEGKSTICYKEPNSDGTFDICGRKVGYLVSDVYKMELCNDFDLFLCLKYYYLDCGYKDGNFFIDGIKHYSLFVNMEGNIVERTSKVKLDIDFNLYSDSLLSILKKEKILKKVI